LLAEIIVSLLIGCAVLALTAAITGTSIVATTSIILGAVASLVSFAILLVSQIFRERTAKLRVAEKTTQITVRLAPESIQDLERIVKEAVEKKERVESMHSLLDSIADLLRGLSKTLEKPLSEKVVQVSEAIKREDFERAKSRVEEILTTLGREAKGTQA